MVGNARELPGRSGEARSEKHLKLRIAPDVVAYLCKLLKSQRMRPPSERTINPRFALKLLAVFPDVTRECYRSVPACRSRAVHFRQRHEIVERLALIERDDLLRAADTELLAVHLRDVVCGHFWDRSKANIAIIWLSVQSA